MDVLIDLTINGTVHHLSTRYLEAGGYFYKGLVSEIDPIEIKPDNVFGGQQKISYGGFRLSPDVFAGDGDFPPPMECDVDVGYVDGTRLEIAASTLNPDDKDTDVTISSGNLNASASVSAKNGVRSAGYASEGKYFASFTINATSASYLLMGLATSAWNLTSTPNLIAYQPGYGIIWVGGGYSGYPTCVAGDTVQIAVDYSASPVRVWFGKNGTWFSGNPETGDTPTRTFSITAGTDIYFALTVGGGSSVLCDFTADTAPAGYGPMEFIAAVENRVTLISGAKACMSEFDRETVGYNIYESPPDVWLLDEAENYDGDTVPLPRAFGTVKHVKPVRLPDAAGKPTFHWGGMTTGLARQITGFQSDAGGTKITYSPATSLSVADIVIEGTLNYDGTYNVMDGDFTDYGGYIILNLTYTAETAKGAIAAQGWRMVYDDGVPIPGNVQDNGDGTFSLNASPVGEITISGNATGGSTAQFASWAAGQLGLTLDNQGYSRAIQHWADSQMLLTEFASNVLAFTSNLFYMDAGYFRVRKLFFSVSDNPDIFASLNDADYFAIKYNLPAPVSLIRSSYADRYAFNSTETGRTVKEDIHEVIVSTGFLYGEEKQMPGYAQEYYYIYNNMDAMLDLLNRWQIALTLPIQNIPLNARIQVTDSSLLTPQTKSFFARRIIYDFDDMQMTIEGEEYIS